MSQDKPVSASHTNPNCPALARLCSTMSTSMAMFPKQYGVDKTAECICNPRCGDVLGIGSSMESDPVSDKRAEAEREQRAKVFADRFQDEANEKFGEYEVYMDDKMASAPRCPKCGFGSILITAEWNDKTFGTCVSHIKKFLLVSFYFFA